MKVPGVIPLIIMVIFVVIALNRRALKGLKKLQKGNSYQRMREMVFSLTYASINFRARLEGKPIFALMELNLSGDIATQVSVADGSTSLYLSTGGGITGGGRHERVREASERFLVQAKNALAFMNKVEDYHPPAEGEVCFYVKNQAGVFRYCASEQNLREGNDPLSQLYVLGHKVLTELRKISP